MPRRISVVPLASHTRTPAGTEIIAAAPTDPALAQCCLVDGRVDANTNAARQLDLDRSRSPLLRAIPRYRNRQKAGRRRPTCGSLRLLPPVMQKG
jgi:hypothetical protein